MSKKTIFFYSGLGLFAVAFCWLIQDVDHILRQDPTLIPLFFKHMLPALQGSLIVGFGFGFPVILLSAILGWGQLILLMFGQISPHLSQEGLIKVLKTLFSQI